MAQDYSRVELKISDKLLEEIDRSAADAGLSRAEWIRQVCNERVEQGYETDDYKLVIPEKPEEE